MNLWDGRKVQMTVWLMKFNGLIWRVLVMDISNRYIALYNPLPPSLTLWSLKYIRKKP